MYFIDFILHFKDRNIYFFRSIFIDQKIELPSNPSLLVGKLYLEIIKIT